MATRWRLKPFEPERVQALARAAAVSPLVAQLLLNRGVTTPEGARVFFENKLTSLHDPALLPGISEAAARIQAAILSNRKIVVYGDYDVDGVCGTSLLWACLKLAGARHVDHYIPHRVEEGYGVNAEALRQLAAEGASMVITVDCGISAVREAKLARELGLELIITDHHHIGHELPDADVLVHPRLPGSSYPFGDLCGCGVALKLAWQVAKSFGDGKKASPHLREFLIESIMLVAMATVADVMPLVDENRLLVTHGLRGLSQSPTVGMQALLDISKIDVGPKGVNAGHIGFKLAPRINAAGRLQRAAVAVDMLTTRDTAQARKIAATLDQCNQERQAIESSMVAEARELVEAGGSTAARGAIVVGKEEWHSGVVGIVASRLVDTYHRPTVVVAIREGVGQGSARSVPGFNLYDAIHACSEGLLAYGGHSAAAGLKMPAEHLPIFTERFNEHCQSALTDEQKERVLLIDAEAVLAQLDMKTLESISALEPHGIGNPRPMVQVNRVKVIGEPRFIGGDAKHLKLRVGQGETTVGVIGWSLAERGRNLEAGSLIDIVGTPGINEYNGRREVQIELKDFRPSQSNA